MKFKAGIFKNLCVLLLTCLASMTASGRGMIGVILVRAQSLSEGVSSVSIQAEDVYLVYIPLVMMNLTEEEPPDEPLMSVVYVKNNTGGRLCYEVRGTGVGYQCFSSGQHFYGQFPSGTYTYHASATCGSITESKIFFTGELVHEFWCQ